MKRHTSFAILGGVIGVVGGVCAGIVVAIATLSVMWVFMFGDDTWPAWAYPAVGVLFFLTLLACVAAGIWFGRQQGLLREKSKASQAEPPRHALY